jgi:Hint-domain
VDGSCECSGELACGIYPACRICGVGGGCFVAGTRVLLADGKSIEIQQLRAGDILLGSHGSRNRVVKLVVMPRADHRVYAFNGGRYFVTDSHPFMTTEGWKAISPEAAHKLNPQLVIGQLKAGDVLLTRTGTVVLRKIRSKVLKDSVVYTPALNKSGTHDYYADGYLVHNKPAPPVEQL